MQYVKNGVVIAATVAAFNAGMNFTRDKGYNNALALLAGGIAAAFVGSAASAFLK